MHFSVVNSNKNTILLGQSVMATEKYDKNAKINRVFYSKKKKFTDFLNGYSTRLFTSFEHLFNF